VTVSTPPGATDWSGRTVVVTGASGGVGRATARWLTERGATVFSLDRRCSDDVVGTFVEVDVLDESSVESAVAGIGAAAGRIDGLVAAAGLSEEPTPAEEMSLDVWQRTIGVNLTGVFLTCRTVGRVMLAQGAGSIVTIASMSGAHIVNVPQRQAAYNASKGGLVALTKSLAFEWAARGIRVNAVSPGYVDTPLLGSKHDLHEQWKGATPLRRFAEPWEVAAAAGWLLGDESSFCVGAELLMDGGYSLA
jgi:NAD(P)-dependent dehydrogenase (short-subunit alcohol dehydrogenase family)